VLVTILSFFIRSYPKVGSQIIVPEKPEVKEKIGTAEFVV
jgi:hypothetical protein